MKDQPHTAIYSRTARAKINLALHVTSQRGDGYHLLDSLVCFAEIGDEIILCRSGSLSGNLSGKPAQRVNLQISGEFAHALEPPQSESFQTNLVERAAYAMVQKLENRGIPCPPVDIGLKKMLPVASGLGGGSADAAAALVLLEKIWGPDTHINLTQIAEGLGADVPMCMDDQPKRVQDIGHLLSPFPLAVSLWVLLVNPDIALATPEVFGALGQKENPAIDENEEMKNRLQNIATLDSIGKVADFLSPLRNDLQSPAISIAPQIGEVLSCINRQQGCLLARISGSGATCFGIFDSKHNAELAAAIITKTNPRWWSVVSRTIPASSNNTDKPRLYDDEKN